MAATGRISSVIDKKAVEAEVSYLENKLNSILSQFKNLAVNIDSVNSKLKGAKTSGDANAIISQNNDLTQKGKKIKSDYEKATIELAKAQERLNYLNNGGAKLEQELYLAREKNRQKQAEIIAQIDTETKANSNLTREQKLSIIAADELAGHYQKLSAAYELNVLKLQKMSKAELENAAIGGKLAKETSAMGSELLKIEQGYGRSNRNVGNYASSTSGLNMAFAQITRELPNVRMGLDMFTLAISNNIPILADQIKYLKIQNEELKNQGKVAPSIGKSLFKAFFSFQTALSVGVTLLTLYGGKLFDLIRGTKNVAEETKKLKERKEELQKIDESAYQTAGKIIGKINQSISVLESENASYELKEKTLKKLQDMYPSILGNLSMQDIKSGKLAETINTVLIPALEAQARAQALSDKIADVFGKQLDLKYKQAQATTDYANALKAHNSAQKEMVYTGIEAFESASKSRKAWHDLRDAAKSYKDIRSQSMAYEKEINFYLNEQKKNTDDLTTIIESGIDKGKGNGGGSAGKATDDRNRYLLEAQKRYQESQINLMQDAEAQEKARINLKYTNEIADLRAKNVLSTELEASLLAERNQELTAVTVKYAKERAKAEQDALNSYYSLMQSQVLAGATSNDQYNQLKQIEELKKLSSDYGSSIQNASPEQIVKLTEDYEKKKTAIVKKYEDERLQAAIRTAELLVGMLPENSKERLDAEKSLLDAKIALGNAEVEANEEKNKKIVSDDEKAAKKRKELEKELSETRWEISKELVSSLGSLVESYFESQSQKLDALSEKDEKNKEKELERAEGNQELTERINKKYDEKQEQREKKEKEINIAKAKAKKLEGVFSIIISTAKAIAEHLATPELIPFDIAMGAIQEAVVLAQPLPKYFKGRENGKAEFAHVGEHGFEGVVTKENKMFLTPDRDTVTFLPEGAKVIPHDKMMKMSGNMTASKLPLWSSSITSSDMRMLRKDVKALQGGFKMVAKVINSKPEYHSNLTAKGLEKFVKRGNSVTKYIEKSIKF